MVENGLDWATGMDSIQILIGILYRRFTTVPPTGPSGACHSLGGEAVRYPGWETKQVVAGFPGGIRSLSQTRSPVADVVYGLIQRNALSWARSCRTDLQPYVTECTFSMKSYTTTTVLSQLNPTPWSWSVRGRVELMCYHRAIQGKTSCASDLSMGEICPFSRDCWGTKKEMECISLTGPIPSFQPSIANKYNH